jgi:hypothetical protein
MKIKKGGVFKKERPSQESFPEKKKPCPVALPFTIWGGKRDDNL